MRHVQKTLFIAVLFWTTFQLSAQVTTVRRYNPSGNAEQPQTYSTEISNPDRDAAARRAKALAKVQGTPEQTPSTLTSKGGTSPVQYSTDSPAPAQYSSPKNPSTTLTVNGANMSRNIRAGKGQVGNLLFTPISELHYVQFAVYCRDTPVDKAPPIEGLMLLWHEGTKCPGGEPGASYIVKGYDTAADAKAAVTQFKAKGFDCWYNPTLTGAAVEVIGVRS